MCMSCLHVCLNLMHGWCLWESEEGFSNALLTEPSLHSQDSPFLCIKLIMQWYIPWILSTKETDRVRTSLRLAYII